MDSPDAITAVRLASAIVVMGYASVLDWRTRRVGNLCWIALAMIGLVLLPVQLILDDEPVLYLLVLIPIIAVLADIYWEADDESARAKYGPVAMYGIAIIAVVLLSYLWISEEYFQHMLAIPVMMLVIVIFYMTDIVRGGADAKALISLTILFPLIPSLGELPILQTTNVAAEVFFPFSFVVLINAAIIVAVLPIGFLMKNLASNEFSFPVAFLGYRMDLKDIPGRHVWLMERVEDGVHRAYVKPRRDEDLAKEIDLLSKAGFKRAWVTPKIPFIIPLTISLVLSTVLGNILLLIIPL